MVHNSYVPIVLFYLFYLILMAKKIQDIYLFEGMDAAFITKLIDNSRTERIPAGQAIIEQGDNSDNYAYVIEEGSAKVDINGQEINTLDEGDVFGEIALITHEPRTATVTTLTEVKVLKINKKLLQDVLNTLPNGERLKSMIRDRITMNLQKVNHISM